MDVSKVIGSHSLTTGFMGVDLRLTTANSSQFSPNFGPNFTQGPNPTAADPDTGFGFASFLLRTGTDGNITLNADAAFQKSLIGAYFNDEWKTSRKLTLQLGLRWDMQTAPTDRFDRLSY